MSPSKHLTSLPDDILLYLLLRLDVPSIFRFRQTCRDIYLLSQAKLLWMHLYTNQIVEGKIPFAPYWDHLNHLDALHLETLVVHALRLERRLCMSETPVVVPLTQKRSITWVQLVRSEWLLVASSDAGTSVITLWSIPHLLSACDTPVPLAEAFLSAPVKTGCIDAQANTVIFALELRGRIDSIEILSIVDDNGSPRICRLQTLDNMAHIRFLKDESIGVSLVNNLNIPSIVNWRDGSVKNLRPGPDLEGGAIAMHMGEGWVSVVRMTVIEIYVLQDNEYQCWSTQGLSSCSLRCLPRLRVISESVYHL
ncbi:hypothetical protein QCA50_020016 [Cerrena zonata]|uniref:F-box domain-containing protein n=1 Tax=Cerrena zonata TaxID=2478898 RepID=A0AAW0FB33_9APHY